MMNQKKIVEQMTFVGNWSEPIDYYNQIDPEISLCAICVCVRACECGSPLVKPISEFMFHDHRRICVIEISFG